jgi:biopolymer transport protein ExbD
MRLRHFLPCAVVALVCGGVSATGPAPPPREVVRYTARVTSTTDGVIEKITLHDDGVAKALDLKADVKAFAKRLKELAEKHKDQRLKLTIEIDLKLLPAHVVELVDASIEAGIEDVSPTPLNPKKP